MSIVNRLEKALGTIRENLQQNYFISEENVKQGIVERILAALEWDICDIFSVVREFCLEGRRVDYALFNSVHRPLVFIEVKKLGASTGADRQLFEYVFLQGVPMAILTDGREWSFYLPAQQGHYGERRVYKLDLLERSIEESIYRLERYLSYENICSGQALKDAQSDYQNVAKNREIEKNLPKAWTTLLKEQNSLLLELLANKVEDLCGYKPDLATCSTFFKNYINNTQNTNNSKIESIKFPRKYVSKTESNSFSDKQISQSFQHSSQEREISKNKINSRFRADENYSLCILKIESILKVKLIKKNRKNYQTQNNKFGFSLGFSSRDEKGKYWFGFHPSQESHLTNFDYSYFVAICSDQNNIFLIPLYLIQTNKKSLSMNKKQGSWHIHINEKQENFVWLISKEVPEINLEKYHIEAVLNYGNPT